MRHFTETETPERVVPAYTERKFSHVSCDLCGNTILRPELALVKDFDICTTCFNTEVVPFLESKSTKLEV